VSAYSAAALETDQIAQVAAKNVISREHISMFLCIAGRQRFGGRKVGAAAT